MEDRKRADILGANEEVLILIRDYLEAVAAAFAKLKAYIGDQILEGPGPRGSRFPKTGVLPDGTEYQFHGNTCTLDKDEKAVSFVLGPGGDLKGFEVSKLWLYYHEHTERFSFKYLSYEDIKSAVERLRRDGLVRRSSGPYSKLFYLEKDAPQ